MVLEHQSVSEKKGTTKGTKGTKEEKEKKKEKKEWNSMNFLTE